MKADPGSPFETEAGAVIEPFAPHADWEMLFQRLARLPHCVFLDSARRDPVLGRYSFLAADPFDYLELPADGSDALAELAQRLARWHTPSIAGLPPFQGGAAGLIAYDLGRSLERVPAARIDEFQMPALAVGFYDVVLAIDHVENQAWLISQGFPAQDPVQRRRRAADRLAQFRGWLEVPVATPSGATPHAIPGATAGSSSSAPPGPTTDSATRPTLRRDQLAPQFPVPGPEELTSSFSAEAYLAAIRRAIEYVHAGDVFQVNIAQRLLYPAVDDSVSLYLRLRRRNPATFAGYFDLGHSQIVSASPERFLKVCDRQVEARPIKGTRQRMARPEADLFAGDELLENEKERAENVMIVDLLRNDLSRVCRPDSVQVTQLCRLETYEFVQHLVSAVCGTLAEGRGAIDLLRASFPGGSVTGAPKVRAMEIIAELEPTARGAYCGALGYLGFDGGMDTNLLIRTITAAGSWWQAPVGGGIVAQSVPEREYEETWHKARGLIRALRP